MATQGEAAAHIGISRRQFVDLLDFEVIKRKSEGAYDLSEVARQVVAHYKGRAIGELDKQKTRVAEKQADRLEMDIAERKKHLLPLDLFIHAWLKLVEVFRTNAMAIPSAKATRFVGLKTAAQAEERLREVINGLLRSISSTDPQRVIAGYRADTLKRKGNK